MSLYKYIVLVVLIVLLSDMSTLAAAADYQKLELNPTMLVADASPAEPVTTSVQMTETDAVEEPSLPISLSLSYAIYSDYIWRGINFSEYQGEGREKPNHQFSVDVALDLSILGLGDLGTIGYNTWFEWYAAQKKLNPERGGQNLQEVDYTIYYHKSIDPIATDLTLSVVFIQLPNTAHTLRQDRLRGNNNDDRTVDYRILLEHNDAWMWKWLFPDNKDGILNPSFFLAHDFGAILGVWMEFGISHEFAIPGIDNLTITPGYKLMAQCDYWKHGFFLAGDQWSLAANYDLTQILRLPPSAGQIIIGGELYFFNAFGNFEGPDFNGQIRSQDEFWGGLTVNWSWGG
ncbi:MAG: hypothetical protein JSV03_17230 [Planctomycetota bacterium]|nr:MAG: hypothetical protein JSV03_17230 [Planctomycetota bacterium]